MILTRSRLKRAECSIIVFRADGTVEDLGVVCENDYPGLFKRLFKRVRRK